MDEYISREAVLEHLNKCKEDPLFDPDMARICFAISIFIENMQAADVQPIRHGRWIDHEKFERKNCNVCIECSVCNTWFGHDCIPKTKFCPYCGARMKQEAENA